MTVGEMFVYCLPPVSSVWCSRLYYMHSVLPASSSTASLSPALLLAALRAHGWRLNTEEQDAHEMLHVVMTTIEEELEFRKADAKPSHASLLDISNIGLEDDEDSVGQVKGSAGKRTPARPRGTRRASTTRAGQRAASE